MTNKTKAQLTAFVAVLAIIVVALAIYVPKRQKEITEWISVAKYEIGKSLYKDPETKGIYAEKVTLKRISREKVQISDKGEDKWVVYKSFEGTALLRFVDKTQEVDVNLLVSERSRRGKPYTGHEIIIENPHELIQYRKENWEKHKHLFPNKME